MSTRQVTLARAVRHWIRSARVLGVATGRAGAAGALALWSGATLGDRAALAAVGALLVCAPVAPWVLRQTDPRLHVTASVLAAYAAEPGWFQTRSDWSPGALRDPRPAPRQPLLDGLRTVDLRRAQEELLAARDPWGRSLALAQESDAPLDGPQIVIEASEDTARSLDGIFSPGWNNLHWRVYSRGPDGMDDGGRCDDVLPYSRFEAAPIQWLHDRLPASLVAAALVVALFHAARRGLHAPPARTRLGEATWCVVAFVPRAPVAAGLSLLVVELLARELRVVVSSPGLGIPLEVATPMSAAVAVGVAIVCVRRRAWLRARTEAEDASSLPTRPTAVPDAAEHDDERPAAAPVDPYAITAVLRPEAG